MHTHPQGQTRAKDQRYQWTVTESWRKKNKNFSRMLSSNHDLYSTKRTCQTSYSSSDDSWWRRPKSTLWNIKKICWPVWSYQINHYHMMNTWIYLRSSPYTPAGGRCWCPKYQKIYEATKKLWVTIVMGNVYEKTLLITATTFSNDPIGLITIHEVISLMTSDIPLVIKIGCFFLTSSFVHTRFAPCLCLKSNSFFVHIRRRTNSQCRNNNENHYDNQIRPFIATVI